MNARAIIAFLVLSFLIHTLRNDPLHAAIMAASATISYGKGLLGSRNFVE